MQSLFVTGTDTDVGKTIVAAALLSIARHNRIDAVPMKPIQSGCEDINGKLIAPDLRFSMQSSGLTVSSDEEQSLCPYKFPLPCSPHLAAAEAGESISFDTIHEHFNILKQKREMVIVEGAGGILVPIDAEKTMLDLMKHLNLPVVLVSRPGLGTINHTLLSLAALNQAGLVVAGVIFCEASPEEDNYIVEDNKKIIARLGTVPILGTFSYIQDIDKAERSPDNFYSLSEQRLPEITQFLKEL